MKVCIRCKEEREEKEFAQRRNVCRVCRNKAQNERYVPKPYDDSFDIKVVLMDGIEVEHKKCKICLTSLPLDNFYKVAICKQGISAKCKFCMGYKGKHSHAIIKNITVNGETAKAKSCSKCRNLKPLNEFRVRLGREHQKVGSRLSYCKLCESDIGKEKINTESDEQRKKRRERSRKYEKSYRGRRIELYHESKDKHKFLSKIKDAKRWAKKSKLRSDFTAEEHAEVMSLFNNRCALSNESEDITLDHFIPLWTGHGGSYKGNLYPLSGSLNYSKQHNNPFEWAKRDYIEKEIDVEKWNSLITYLAKQNKLTKAQFEEYTYWCFSNKREAQDIMNKNKDSVKEFLKSKELDSTG